MTSAPREQNGLAAAVHAGMLCLARYWPATSAALCAALYAVRLWMVHASVPSPRVFHDTEFYFRSAQNSLFSSEIWAGGRPAVPLLWFKACALDVEVIRRSLTILSAFSWAALACSIWLTSGSGVARAVGAALVFTVASSLNVLQWNEVVLSESLSDSCWALFTAAALLYLRRRGYWAIAVVLLAATLALCRDSNSYFVLFCGVLLTAAALNRLRSRAPWRNEAIVGAACVAIFVLDNALANAGQRWEYPLTNVIYTRILPNKKAVAELADLGMPVNGALRPGRPRRAYDTDPRLEPFNDWVSKHGKRAYVHYLAAHPVAALGAPELSVVLGGDIDQYQPQGIRNERTLLDALWSKRLWLWHIVLLVLLGCAAGVLQARSSLIVLGLSYAVLLFPHAAVIWHADSMEVARHGVPVALQLQLALVLMLIGTFEGAMQHWKEQRSRL